MSALDEQWSKLKALGRDYGLPVGHLDGGEAEVQIAEHVLRLPSANVLGRGVFMRAYPWSLVHGDMHGGNVLLEIADADDSDGDRDQVRSLVADRFLDDDRMADPVRFRYSDIRLARNSPA